MRVGAHDRHPKDVTVVSPQVQTATSSRRTLSDQSHSPYERVLAVGLGVALALVAALALMVPTATSSQTATDGAAVVSVAHGKATTPRGHAAATAGDGSTSVE